MAEKPGDFQVNPTSMPAPKIFDSAVSEKQRAKLAFMLALAANILWGTSFLGSKYTLLLWGPWSASALRFAFALVLLAGLSLFSKQKISPPKSAKDWWIIFAVGLSGFGFLYPLQLTGLQTISSAKSAAIMLTSPLFVICLARFFLSESMTLKKIIAIGFGITGGLLLLAPKIELGGSKNIGDILTLLASLTLAGSVIFTRIAGKTFNALNLTFWSMLVGLLFIVPFAIIENPLAVKTSEHFLPIAALGYLVLVCSVLCFWMWNSAIALAPTRHLASTMHIKTPVAVALGAFVIGERFDVIRWIGLALVMVGVFTSQLPERKSS